MKKLLIIILSAFIFTTTSADTTKIKDKFFSSIESLLDSNFEDTDFSIKSKEGRASVSQASWSLRSEGKRIESSKRSVCCIRVSIKPGATALIWEYGNS